MECETWAGGWKGWYGTLGMGRQNELPAAVGY